MAATIVYVRLLDEGTDVMRPVPAFALGHGKFRLLAAKDGVGEIWEFRPGTVVRCGLQRFDDNDILVAVEEIPETL